MFDVMSCERFWLDRQLNDFFLSIRFSLTHVSGSNDWYFLICRLLDNFKFICGRNRVRNER